MEDSSTQIGVPTYNISFTINIRPGLENSELLDKIVQNKKELELCLKRVESTEKRQDRLENKQEIIENQISYIFVVDSRYPQDEETLEEFRESTDANYWD